ncbi:MAG: tRNA pseudouridine(38-40) synthase TruA [Proteobacteria bacterium]|nr:tRNA pseudouridine(38-40) synthase TruA [Pseudomonadota bacterium]NDC24521.1 tRNA pseudouridine(38-40) synthase TruA [Pseudomonadota bacterium]NDD04440.1 tRNA pseudouridine(38-40) synthase TruA [Pseudomonadota bacterium]NDG26760.1 tRNA pseudouridine(38-40) synthase TruA [Pseudomonadota bacterium]
MSLDNILLKIEYDGSDFSGWQRQPNHPTIQASIEDVLRKFTGKKVVVYGASRTDSGVHARGQIANFEVEPKMAPERWAPFLNSNLPRSIRIIESKRVPERFHAQKMARSKIYEYRIMQRSCPSALDKAIEIHPAPLNWEAIRKAMPYFVGEKDFKAFQGARSSVLTTVRTIYRFDLFEEGKGVYRFEIEGNGFLKQMVRAIVGTLLEVGTGKKKPEEIPDIIESRDRRLAGHTAEPRGLCLVRVNYSQPY